MTLRPIDDFQLSVSDTQIETFVPGRVNLIGEHLDYNGGDVLPMAVELGVTVRISSNNTGSLRISSDAYPGAVERSLHDQKALHWSDHVVGAYQVSGIERQGFDIKIASNLPFGSGLSSSAAVSVAVLRGLYTLSGLQGTPNEFARLAQLVEHSFIGVPCGIMDQMAVANLMPSEVMRLATDTLAFQKLKVPVAWCFVVHHSGQVRSLNEGRYALRRHECENAAKMLGVSLLCRTGDKSNVLEKASAALTPTTFRRLRHVLTEQQRVELAANAMSEGNASQFGRLMIESHESMRKDFEITTPLVDKVVATSLNSGAIGARMTGGGFGGCVVSLVHATEYDEWLKRFSGEMDDPRIIC